MYLPDVSPLGRGELTGSLRQTLGIQSPEPAAPPVGTSAPTWLAVVKPCIAAGPFWLQPFPGLLPEVTQDLDGSESAKQNVDRYSNRTPPAAAPPNASPHISHDRVAPTRPFADTTASAYGLFSSAADAGESTAPVGDNSRCSLSTPGIPVGMAGTFSAHGHGMCRQGLRADPSSSTRQSAENQMLIFAGEAPRRDDGC